MGLRIYSDVTLHGHKLNATVYENVGGGTGSEGTDDYGNSYDNKRTSKVPDGEKTWIMPGISGDAESDYWVELRQQYQGSGPEPEVDKFMLDVPAASEIVIFYGEDLTLIEGEPRTAEDKSLFWDTDVDWGQSQAQSNVMYGDDAQFNPWTETQDLSRERWYFGARYNGTSDEMNFEGDVDEIRLFDEPLSDLDIYATEQTSKGSNGIPLTDETIVDDGGIHRYSMDNEDIDSGIIKDTWGAQDATMGTGITTGVQGISKSEAISFDGSDNITTDWVPSFGTGDFSVSMWVKQDSWSDDTFAATYNTNSESTGFICEYDSGNLRFWIESSDDLQVSANIPTEQWVHLAFVRRNGTQYIYMDNTLIGSQNSTNSADTSSDPFELGSRGGALQGRVLTGEMDEVRVYDKGLTETEVENLYVYEGPVGLARYEVDNVSGSTLPDSWNNYDGTITGATVVSGGAPDTTDFLSFDGDDYVDIGDGLPIQKDFTISANIRWDGTDRGYVFNGELNGSESDFQLLVDGSGDVQWKIKERDGVGDITTSYSLDSNTWYHITAVSDAFSQELRLYIDGVKQKTSKVIGSSRNSYNGLEGSVSLGYPSEDENGSNLWAYYPLGEESGSIAVDVTNNKYDGTYLDANLGSNGILSQPCPTFDGIDDGIDLPSGLDFTGESAITVSCWFKVEAGVLGGSNTFHMVGDEGNETFILRWDDGMFEFVIHDGSTFQQNVGYNNYPTTGIWHHIAGVYDGSDLIFYYDGEEVDRRQGIDSNLGGLGSAAPAIGYRRVADDRHWDGELGHIRLYNRALSSNEVFEDLYDVTKGYITTDSRLL